MQRNQDIEWTAGDHHDISFAILDAAGDPQDITGWTLEWQLSRSPSDAVAISKSSDDAAEIEVTDASTGVGLIHLLPTDTVPAVGDVVSGIFEHELSSTDGSGTVATELSGKATIGLGL